MAVAFIRRDRERVEELDERFTRAKQDREQYERQWLTNLAFYMDRHWLVWDNTQRTLRAPKVAPWRVHATVNLVRGTVRTEYAKLIQNRPQPRSQPASGDPDDEEQARACDDFIEHISYLDGSETAWERAVLWALITGTGILKTYWNKDAGTPLLEPETLFTQDGLSVLNPRAGHPVVTQKGEPVHLGDIETVDCSPFEFYPDPFGLEMRQKGWAFYVKLRSPEYVRERYGEDIGPTSAGETFDGQVATMLGQNAKSQEGVLLKEYSERPTRKNPKGRYAVYANERLLEEGENPYPKVSLPFTAVHHIPVPGRFWGDSIVSSIIDPQRNLNKARSQAIEHRNLLAKGKYFVVDGALRPGQVITSAPGEIVTYKHVPSAPDGGRPHLEQGAPVPDSYWKDIEQSRQEINEVSGVNEVSRSELPSGQKLSGIGIAYLQEQDDTRLSPTAHSAGRAAEDLGKFRLELARQFYDEPRMLRIIGPNNSVRVREFRREDIPDEVDVRVVAGAGLPKSRLAKQQLIFDLWDKKIVTDPRAVVKLLEFGEVDGLHDDIQLDIAQAERENEALKAGDPQMAPAPEDFHNHDVHIAEHDRSRKSEEYERLPDEVRALFAAHVLAHKEMMLERQAERALLGAEESPMERAILQQQQPPEPPPLI